jgi:hypothetical protein
MVEARKCKYLLRILKVDHILVLVTTVSTFLRRWSFSTSITCSLWWSYYTWELPSLCKLIKSCVDGWILVLHDKFWGSEHLDILKKLFVLLYWSLKIDWSWNLKSTWVLWKSNGCKVLALKILISSAMIFNLAWARAEWVNLHLGSFSIFLKVSDFIEK